MKILDQRNVNALKGVIVSLFIVSVLASPLVGTALAQYFPPIPPPDIVVDDAKIVLSFTKPSASIFINVSEYNPNLIIKGVSINFTEPVEYIEITFYVLNSKPLEVEALDGVVVLYYFTIRALSKLGENVENVTLDVVVKKDLITEKRVDEGTIAVYRYYEGAWKKYPTQQLGEDESFLYLRSDIEGLSHFAIAGMLLTQFPTTLSIALVVIVFLLLVIGIYVYYYRRAYRRNLRLFTKSE